MVSVGRHKNIHLMAYSEVESVSGYVGSFNVRVKHKPRYIDESACTGCAQCADVCPITVSNPFDLGLSTQKASYRQSAQAVPGAFTIEKLGMAPCREACPADQRAMGYIALIREGRYADAYWAIRREHPFPSVCGRVCNHPCEEACSRGLVDEPVNIMGLKRFVTDWAYTHRDELAAMQDKSLAGTPFQHDAPPTGQQVAIIGAGPAGLTAALDLVRLGHRVNVFDDQAVAGGMIRVGIPPHRLPYALLDWEVQQIVDEGVNIQLNTWVDDIPGLLDQGYDAVVVATGAHKAIKLDIPGADHPDNWLSLDLLRRTALDEAIDLSQRDIIVLGAGDVALDVARVAVRLGNPTVKILCRGMRASAHEIQEAQAEGVTIIRSRVFKEVVIENGQIVGIRCLEAEVGGIVNGRRQVKELPGTDHIIPGDMVIWALGQRPDLRFLPEDDSIATGKWTDIRADDDLMTTRPGVFTAGDVRRGATYFVVDAVAEGHQVARGVDRYLRGAQGLPEPHHPAVVNLTEAEVRAKIAQGAASDRDRIPTRTIPPAERHNNFREVTHALTEQEALAEAERCVQCGVCAECMECVTACDRGAIDHDMQPTYEDITVGTIILATGFQDFDPGIAPEYGYNRLDNVITAMEFERLINNSGPTGGRILMRNGQPPQQVAIIHCVGSRDDRYHEYCSRACCMYSLKLAQLVHDYVDAEVHEIYRDMRTFGKDYEELYNRIKHTGVHFYHGRVNAITRQNGNLLVSWDESFYNQPDHVEVDMVILSTGLEPQADAGQVASRFGISRGEDGFFLERHPKLGPVETSTAGIFLAGACQSPKDIPDSVAQAGGAAAAALSLIDQGTVYLDPSVAQVNRASCVGCGQCAAACPYQAIDLVDELAVVNAYQCKGCGTCAATCPNKAMTLIHYDDRQIIAELTGALSAMEVAQ
jgi:heterodisulfide reductase subunit A